jgi:Cell division protein CrgA
MARLGLYQADQIGIPGGSQIGALRVQRADDDHQSGKRAHRCGERTSKRSAIAIPPPMGDASSPQNRDQPAPSIGDRTFGQNLDLSGSSREFTPDELLRSLAGQVFDYATYFNSKENLVPESRTRKSAEEKQKLKARQTSKPKKLKAPASRRWVPPTFIAVGLLGVAWLITYYVAGTYIPFMDALGNWNILIGMGGMAAAFAIATLWR